MRAPLAPSHSWHGCAVWVCVFGLGFWLRPALLAGVLGCVCAPLAPSHSWPRVRGVCVCVWARVSAAPRHSWLGCWVVCVLRLRPATPGTGAQCGCVCLGSGVSCAPPLLAGVLGCVCAPLAPSHSWPRVRGVCVCVWARVSAAPRHSWLGCWVVCVLRLHPATPGTGAQCGCVCLGSGVGCAPPLLAGVLGCVCAPLAPSHSWPRVRGVGVCVWARVSAAPRHSWLGCWAVCVLRLHPATPGCVCPWVLCCAFPVLFALCGAVLRCAGALALCCWCGACCCWRPVLWCAAVCCAVSSGLLWCGAGSGGPWLSAGAVLWRPAVGFALLVLLVCVFSLCVRCCVALRVVLFGSGCACAVVGASCCSLSLCVVVSPWAFCGVVVPLWCVVVSCCAVRCPVVSCALCCVLRCCAALRCCAGGLCCAVVCAAGVCFSFCPSFLC